MLLISNTLDETDIDDEMKPINRSSLIIKNILFLGICLVLLILMIIVLTIMKNLTIEFLLLIIIGVIAIVLVIGLRIIKFRIELKKNNVQTLPKNNVRQIVIITSICLTIFIILFAASVMAPLNFGYGSFGTFVLYFIYISTLIWILTLIIYLSIIVIRSIWRKCLFIRQNLSSGIISFFLGSFLLCSLFMLINAIPTGSIFTGFGLGLALSLSYILFIGGIIALILYRSKFLFGFLSIIGCLGIILLLWFYFIDGYNMKIDVIIPSERFPTNITHDPSLNGNYSYSFLTYGSGFDHRNDYGKKASIITPTIDLSSLIKIASFNKKVFQFNESSLPLNGRIWYPINNTGPCPIVLMVHGNHILTESSEIGYDYLGEMLASQGFLAVSIDENFLNSAPFSFSSIEYGQISKLKKYILSTNYGPEYIARAIIILETLKQFRLWNEDKTNQFYHQLDLSNIGLMGHSRGGEAIIIAYLFNQLNYLPDYPSNVLFTNYNFGIKVLFSISGTDDGYIPLGRSLQFSDVTLFAIQGIYDGDLSEFSFQSTIKNLKFLSNSSYHFKASLYVHQANHGQFNTNWGRYDLFPGTNQLMNVHPLMKIEEQQHISKIYMSTLMNIVLKNQTKYRILFEDYRAILNYLPHTNYISTFQDSDEIIIADFENYDVMKGTIEDSKINVTNLFLWSSVYIKIYRSVMLLLQPMEKLTGIYTIHLQNSLNGSQLRFSIGRPSEGLIDYLIVRVFYEIGTTDSFDVRVLPALIKQIYKISSEEYVIAVQTISLPLLHPIIGVEFVVNGTNAQFLIDNIVIVK